MKVLIIEDEKPAAERLKTLLHAYDPGIELLDCLQSIEEAVLYFSTKPHPDLLLLDIHLSDGHSFEIFKHVHYDSPIVFTTAYDNYMLEAFKLVSIDYILKPVTLESLAAAINKMKSMSRKFSTTDLDKVVNDWNGKCYKQRFLGKVGQRLFFIDACNIAYFQAANKIVYLVDKKGNRFVIEHTMEKLQQQLNPDTFFRVNRTYIVNNSAIQLIKPYINNRLKLIVDGAAPQDELVISRERVAEFKSWADN